MKIFKGFTICCALTLCVLGASLDSFDHFGVILGGAIFCTAECLLYLYIWQNGDDW